MCKIEVSVLNIEDYQDPVCPLARPADGKVYHDPETCIPLQEVIAECDRLFGCEQMEKLGDHLRQWRRRAAELSDKRSELSLLNELMGYCRMTGKKEEGVAVVRDGFRLIGEVGISGTVSAGTILLNGATALKSFGLVEEALRHYAEAFRCYSTHLDPDDSRFAGLLNNMASAYLDHGEPRHAEAYYKKALSILQKNGNLMDRAVTEVNLAQLYHKVNPQDPRIRECLDLAFACFEDPAAEYGSYYAHTCRKCAGAFGFFGQTDREAELNGRADALYEGN